MKKPVIQTLTEASAALVSLETKRAEIDNQRQKTQTQIADAHEQIRTQGVTNTEAKKANKVAEFLGDKPTHTVVDMSQLKVLYDQHSILEAAFEELSERINRERLNTGRQIAEKLKDYHAELVGGIVKNLNDAYNSFSDYKAFRNEMEAKGIGMAPLMPMSVSLVEKIGGFMNDAVRCGHVKKNAVPAGVLS